MSFLIRALLEGLMCSQADLISFMGLGLVDAVLGEILDKKWLRWGFRVQ